MGMLYYLLLGMSFSSLTYGFTDPQDLFALTVLYTSLNSPPLTGWKVVGGDPCAEAWLGIECAGPNVTAINLPGLSISGWLGYALCNFTALTVLDLSNNQIAQMIPHQLPPTIQELNLASNLFTETLPLSLKDLVSLTSLNLSSNQITGQIPDAYDELPLLATLDLSNNQFVGQIPQSLGNLTSLTTLHLQNNQLVGTIDVLRLLPLQDLNIANNQFMGWIPSSMFAIPSFKFDGNLFNASPAPPPPLLASSPSQGATTGPPKLSPASGYASPITVSKHANERLFWNGGRITGLVVASILAIAVVVLIVMFFSWRISKDDRYEDNRANGTSSWSHIWRTWKDDKYKTSHVNRTSSWSRPLVSPKAMKESGEQKDRYAQAEINFISPALEKPKPQEDRGPSKGITSKTTVAIAATEYTVADLQAATNSFSQDNLIGEGALGRVYKAETSSGKFLAVKKLDSSTTSIQNEDEFLKVVSNIARLRHINIIELVGYCVEHGQRLLVYDYISEGTLYEMLHCTDRSSTKLSWNLRMKVALGTARALEYLHEVCLPAITHRNIKSVNILLDDELNPCVSDCGLAALVPLSSERQVSTQMLTSFGYSAPEYAMSGIYTVKSDVYSFGVVMLELLTGRASIDSSRPRMETSLVKWATPQLHDIDALSRMVDPLLKGMYPAKSLSKFADLIALCVQQEPEFRPRMSEVVQSLVRLMQRASLSKRRTRDDSDSIEPSEL